MLILIIFKLYLGKIDFNSDISSTLNKTIQNVKTSNLITNISDFFPAFFIPV